MGLMVGQAKSGGSAVYALVGDRAINLTSKDETIGRSQSSQRS